MDCLLHRKEKRSDGIFSDMFDSYGTLIADTLEHAYDDGSGLFLPKLYDGLFICKRSLHQLHGMDHQFETFQIMDVIGHSNMLFHWGNWEKDSDGCVITGDREVDSPQGRMVTASRITFDKFMKLQEGVDQFNLKVQS